MTIEDYIKKAIANGAPDISPKVSGWKDLVRLLFSPRGSEFCIDKGFPSLSDFKAAETDLSEYGVYVDMGSIKLENVERAALIGETHGVVCINDGERVHKVLLMHGATAEIIAKNGSVVRLFDEELRARVEKDETSVILY